MSNNPPFYQTGISLVTLILIFLVMGILLVITVPNFMGLDKDMRLTAMNHLEGTLRSSNLVIYAESVLQGVDHYENYHLDLDHDDNPDLYVRYGYARSLADILYAMPKKELSDFLWHTEDNNDANKNYIYHKYTKTIKKCQIRYQRSMLAGDMPVYFTILEKC